MIYIYSSVVPPRFPGLNHLLRKPHLLTQYYKEILPGSVEVAVHPAHGVTGHATLLRDCSPPLLTRWCLVDNAQIL